MTRHAPVVAVIASLAAGLALAACGDNIEPGTSKSIAELQDPTTCLECHPQHYQQWSGSMHAYASDDPVFVAMNKRGQRETDGRLGDLCLRCHAPMALELGLATGASFDPAVLPPAARGVTCYFCHNVASVIDDHNNGLVLANDQTMRGGVEKPVRSPAHFSAYDPLMDSDVNQSELCGSCHDIVIPEEINGVPGGVAVERTFAEWKGTFFATEADPQLHFTCGACHMPSKQDVIADAPGLDVPIRDNGFHEHMWPAIDQALTPFPELEAQAAAIQRDLDPAVRVVGPFNSITRSQPGGICLDPPGILSVRVDSINTGHAFPSGAAQDRRAWLEVIAKNAAGDVVFSSGVVPDGVDPDVVLATDPAMLGLWDRTFKRDNTPAHFFWEVAEIDSQLLKIPAVLGEDHSTTARFTVAGFNDITEITTRVLVRALPFELLDELVASGDLAPTVAAELKTLVVGGGTARWDRATKGTGPAINTNCNPQ